MTQMSQQEGVGGYLPYGGIKAHFWITRSKCGKETTSRNV